MTKITYGNGSILTERGNIDGEGKCLCLTDNAVENPIGSVSKLGPRSEPQGNSDVILVFKNIEGARVLQDELNSLISDWSRDLQNKQASY